MTDQTPTDFPVLDADRSTATADVGRHICDVFPPREPRIPETDAWVAMPLRLAYSQAAGWDLECGPYDLSRADIDRLRNAIAAYDAATGH